MWILIRWLPQKPADLDLKCFQKRKHAGLAGQGVHIISFQLIDGHKDYAQHRLVLAFVVHISQQVTFSLSFDFKSDLYRLVISNNSIVRNDCLMFIFTQGRIQDFFIGGSNLQRGFDLF